MPAPVIDPRSGLFKSRTAAAASLLALAVLIALVGLLFWPLFV